MQQVEDKQEHPEQQQLHQPELSQNQPQPLAQLPSPHKLLNDSLHLLQKQSSPILTDLRSRPNSILPQTVNNNLCSVNPSLRSAGGRKDTNLHSELDITETSRLGDTTTSSVFTKSIGSIFTNINKQVSSAITNLIAGNDPAVAPSSSSQTPGISHAVGPRNGFAPAGGGSEFGNESRAGHNFHQFDVGKTDQRRFPLVETLTGKKTNNHQNAWPATYQNQRQSLKQLPSNYVDYTIDMNQSIEQRDTESQGYNLVRPSDLYGSSSSNVHLQNIAEQQARLNGPTFPSRMRDVTQPTSFGSFQRARNIPSLVKAGHSSIRGEVIQSLNNRATEPWTDNCSVNSLPHSQRNHTGKDQRNFFSSKSSLDLYSQTLAHTLPQDFERYQTHSPIDPRSESPSVSTAFKVWNSIATKETGVRRLTVTPPKPSVLNLIPSHLSVDRMPRVLPSPSVPISRVPTSPEDGINFPHLSASPSHFTEAPGEQSWRKSKAPSTESQVGQSSSFMADQFGRSFSSQQLRQDPELYDIDSSHSRYTSQILNRALRLESSRPEYQNQPMIEENNRYQQMRDNMSKPSVRGGAPSECIEINRLRRDHHMSSVASLPKNYPMTQNFKPNVKTLIRDRLHSSKRLLPRDECEAPDNDDSDSDDDDWC